MVSEGCWFYELRYDQTCKKNPKVSIGIYNAYTILI